MRKPNILFKKKSSLSGRLLTAPTSRHYPQIYNSNYATKYEFQNGAVDKYTVVVDKKRWDEGYPGDIESA